MEVTLPAQETITQTTAPAVETTAPATETVETTTQAEAQVTQTEPAVTNTDPVISERQKFIDKLSQFYLQTGTLEPVIKAMSTDYSKMSPEELLRLDLKERYPDLSDDRFERLYRKQVIDKYTLDADLYDEDDVALGRDLISHEAEQIRKRLSEKVSEWMPPSVDPAEAERQQKEATDKWMGIVNSAEENRKMNEGKTVTYKSEGLEFNLGVQPEKVMEITADMSGEKFFQLFAKRGEDGTVGVDFDAWNQVVAFALDRQALLKGVYDLGRSHAGKEIIDKDVRSVDIGTGGLPDSPNAEDERIALLKSFLTKKA